MLNLGFLSDVTKVVRSIADGANLFAFVCQNGVRHVRNPIDSEHTINRRFAREIELFMSVEVKRDVNSPIPVFILKNLWF